MVTVTVTVTVLVNGPPAVSNFFGFHGRGYSSSALTLFGDGTHTCQTMALVRLVPGTRSGGQWRVGTCEERRVNRWTSDQRGELIP